MAGVSRAGALELVFACPACGEHMVAFCSGDKAVPLHSQVRELYVGGIEVGRVAAAAEAFGVHACDDGPAPLHDSRGTS